MTSEGVLENSRTNYSIGLSKRILAPRYSGVNACGKFILTSFQTPTF